MIAPWKKNSDQPKQHIKKQRNYFMYQCNFLFGFNQIVTTEGLVIKENFRELNYSHIK